MNKNECGKCPLYDPSKLAVHGLRCTSPICAPLVDCEGHISSGKCTVPAIAWKTIVLNANADLPLFGGEV